MDVVLERRCVFFYIGVLGTFEEEWSFCVARPSEDEVNLEAGARLGGLQTILKLRQKRRGGYHHLKELGGEETSVIWLWGMKAWTEKLAEVPKNVRNEREFGWIFDPQPTPTTEPKFSVVKRDLC